MLIIKDKEIIEEISKIAEIDPALISAIIKVESSWNSRAYRYEPHIKTASYGYMQILLTTAQWVLDNKNITGEELYDPYTNILIGSRYLKDLLNKYKELPLAISAYNAGKPISGNKIYVDNVLKWYDLYKVLFPYEIPILIGSAGIFVLLILLYNSKFKKR